VATDAIGMWLAGLLGMLAMVMCAYYLYTNMMEVHSLKGMQWMQVSYELGVGMIVLIL